MYTEQFSPEFDFPEQKNIEVCYIICSTPRSGSHLLGHLLYQTQQFGFPLEYFNPSNIPEWRKRFGTKSLEDTFEQIQKHRTSQNGCFGCKLHYPHFNDLIKKRYFNAFFPQAYYIWLQREDVLSQAISLARARSEQKWISSQPDIQQSFAQYNFQSIDSALKEIIFSNSKWEYFLVRRRKPVLKLTYEEVTTNTHKVINDISNFLGISYTRIESSLSISPKKQRDQINEIWKEKYLEDVAARSYRGEIDFLEKVDVASIPFRSLLSEILSKLKQRLLIK